MSRIYFGDKKFPGWRNLRDSTLQWSNALVTLLEEIPNRLALHEARRRDVRRRDAARQAGEGAGGRACAELRMRNPGCLLVRCGDLVTNFGGLFLDCFEADFFADEI